MHIKYKNLTIRDAMTADAEQLTAWWNDGAVMAHAGFPNGLGTTVEEVNKLLKQFDQIRVLMKQFSDPKKMSKFGKGRMKLPF